MKPKGINIKVKKKHVDSIRKSGIIIPSTIKNPNLVWGEVLDVGEAVEDDIRVGDVLFYASGDSYKETKGALSEETGEQLVSVKNILFWRHNE